MHHSNFIPVIYLPLTNYKVTNWSYDAESFLDLPVGLWIMTVVADQYCFGGSIPCGHSLLVTQLGG